MGKLLDSVTFDKEFLMRKMTEVILTNKTVMAWIFSSKIEEFKDYSIEELEEIIEKELHVPEDKMETEKKYGIEPCYYEMSYMEEDVENVFFYFINTEDTLDFRSAQYTLLMNVHSTDEKKRMRCFVVNVNNEAHNSSVRISMSFIEPDKESGIGFNMMLVTELFVSKNKQSREEVCKSPLSILLAKNMSVMEKKKEIKNRYGYDIPNKLSESLEMYQKIDKTLKDEKITISLSMKADTDKPEDLN